MTPVPRQFEVLAKLYTEVYTTAYEKSGSSWDAKQAAKEAIKQFKELMDEMERTTY